MLRIHRKPFVNGHDETKKWHSISFKLIISLTDPFIEEPNDIHCIKGEDANLTCKLRLDMPPVKWLKKGIEIKHNEKFIMSTVDLQHTLIIKNTTESDSGYYIVQVGTFSKKIQLNIAGIYKLFLLQLFQLKLVSAIIVQATDIISF